MESRRDFLTQGAGLVAGLSLTPNLRLPEEDRPNAVQLAVRNEVPRLYFELHILRNSLPDLLSPPISAVPAIARNRPSGPSSDRVAGLDQWHRALGDLMRALPKMNGRVPDPTALETFADFHTAHALCYKELLQPPIEPCYELMTGWPPIRWQIVLPRAGLDLDCSARSILSKVNGREFDLPDPWGELERKLPRVRQMIRDIPADFNRLSGTYLYFLPALATIDPEFAVDALDYQRLKYSLVGDAPAIKARATFLTDAFTTGVAFVALALANNRFPRIPKLLEKPDIGGYWATLIPSLLSAVLYRKVVTLRELARAA